MNLLKSAGILTLGILLAGCSTIERYVYYSPVVNHQDRDGPQRQSCGFMNFGGEPDRYKRKSGENEMSVFAEQRFQLYLWGPWFASVAPVFPFTWIAEMFISNDVSIQVYYGGQNIIDIEKVSFSISTADSRSPEVFPSKVIMEPSDRGSGTSLKIRFPADFNKVKKFSLHIRSTVAGIENQDIPFVRTSRWSWTQWTPNC